jgi:hypothetical protein
MATGVLVVHSKKGYIHVEEPDDRACGSSATLTAARTLASVGASQPGLDQGADRRAAATTAKRRG